VNSSACPDSALKPVLGKAPFEPGTPPAARRAWIGLSRALLRFPLILIALPVLIVAGVLVAVPLVVVAHVALIRASINPR